MFKYKQVSYRKITFYSFFLFGLLLPAGPIDFTPNKDELNIPFEFKNGKIKLNLPNPFKKKNPNIIRNIATCVIEDDVINKNSNSNQPQTTTVNIFKSNLLKTADIQIFNESGIIADSHYPFVIDESVSKDELGQYAAAVEVAHILGITQVDSIRIFVLEPNLKEFKGLIFFYDEDKDLIDRTILINKKWRRCL